MSVFTVNNLMHLLYQLVFCMTVWNINYQNINVTSSPCTMSYIEPHFIVFILAISTGLHKMQLDMKQSCVPVLAT